jgi:hypothetical protein
MVTDLTEAGYIVKKKAAVDKRTESKNQLPLPEAIGRKPSAQTKRSVRSAPGRSGQRN